MILKKIHHKEAITVQNVQEIIEIHKNFWARKPTDTPLNNYRIAEDFFFASHYEGMRDLLVPGKEIFPDMLNVDRLLGDYERHFQENLQTNQQAFWTAEPHTGIPWMEGILGCSIIASDKSFVSKPTGVMAEDIGEIKFDPQNEWYLKYIEFATKLTKFSDGRFPVAQPILRGPSDMTGALLGQGEMLYAILRDKDKVKSIFEQVTDVFLEVIKGQYQAIDSFHDGYSVGFFQVWAPGKTVWFQEDLTAILSPALYKELLMGCAEKICQNYPYTAFHLHPTSFFIVDDLLKVDGLRAIEVNKDVGGPSIKEMMGVLKKIIDKKCLIIWGDLDEDDIDCIKEELPNTGLFLNIVAESVDRAIQLQEYIAK